ncbi:hypothetical protein V2O64_21520 [Verrucomicrobiaceae bacterium 227]
MKILLSAILCVLPLAVMNAEDSRKTKYHEAAVNLAKKINLKTWKTFRGGKLVHEYTERDLVRDGSFSQKDEIFYVDGKEVFHIATLDKRKVYSYHPDEEIQVLQVDEDGDGSIDSILFANNNETIEIFRVSADRFAPVPDAELKKRLEGEQKLREAMEAFDKR